MSVLATLLEALVAARRSGVGFDAAWEAASVEALGASCDPGDWSGVLQATEGAWRSAYDRLPASRGEVAVAMIGYDAELEDVGRRLCRLCGTPIAPERRPNVMFCSDPCRRTWHNQHQRVAA
jgi:hypothetical protein